MLSVKEVGQAGGCNFPTHTANFGQNSGGHLQISGRENCWYSEF